MSEHRPDAVTLQAWLDGTLPPAETAMVEAWFESDPESAAELDRMTGVPEISDAQLSAGEPGSDQDADGGLRNLMSRLKEGNFLTGSSSGAVLDMLDEPLGGGRPGRLGTFEIHSILASGGMGVVFAGRDPDLQRPVAIKLLSPRLVDNAQARARFLAEARAVASLDHPDILPVHSVHERGAAVYFVMPLVAGETLAERITRTGPLSPREAAKVGLHAARALAAAHEINIVHRDIKPANILLEGERVRVVDFGIAEWQGGTGSGSGTPDFMAPEQVSGGIVTAASDLYSLGATLHAAVTGGPPGTRPGKVPGWLGALVARLLDPDPAKRPASAAVVAREIARRIRRRLLPVAMAGAAGAVMLAAGAAALTPLGITGWLNRTEAAVTDRKFHVEGRRGTYATLTQAAQAAAGRVIFADFDGERPVPLTDFGTFEVTLRAAPDRRPVLRQDKPGAPMLMSKAMLRLDGLTLLRPASAEAELKPLAQVVNAPMILTNCRVIVRDSPDGGRADPLRVIGQGSLTLRSTEVSSGSSPWMAVRRYREVPGAAPVEVLVEDCRISGAYFSMEPSPGLEVNAVLKDSQITGEFGFAFWRKGDAQLNVRAERCTFEISGTLVWMQNPPPEGESALTWSGSGNRYLSSRDGGLPVFFRTTPSTVRIDSLSEWQAMHGVSGTDG